jgi:MoaE-MoaD fusion protein
VRLEVRTFGGLAERAGLTSLAVELPPGADVGMLREAVAHAHPELAPLLSRVAVAVDLEIVGNDLVLLGDEEIALLPPVAGGADSGEPTAGGSRSRDPATDETDTGSVVTGLVRGRFDVDRVLARIAGADVGAVVSFLGSVRDHAEDLAGVVRLDYSAYEAMAERELARIATEVLTAHPEVTGLALLHALGELAVGEHTILVAAASAHREAAFTACRVALEAVKARVPVFKREVTVDGAHRWVGLAPVDPGGASD